MLDSSLILELVKKAQMGDEKAKEILVEKESKVDGGIAVHRGEQKIDTNANVAEIVNVLKEMDMDTVSPLMAFGTLQNLVDKVKK